MGSTQYWVRAAAPHGCEPYLAAASSTVFVIAPVACAVRVRVRVRVRVGVQGWVRARARVGRRVRMWVR